MRKQLAVLEDTGVVGSTNPRPEIPILKVVLHPTEESILSVLLNNNIPVMDLSLLARVHAFVQLQRLSPQYPQRSYGVQTACIWNTIIMPQTEHICDRSHCMPGLSEVLGYCREKIQKHLLTRTSFAAMATPAVSAWFLMNGFQMTLSVCPKEYMATYPAERLIECFPNHGKGVVGDWMRAQVRYGGPDRYFTIEDLPDSLYSAMPHWIQ